MLKPSPLLLFQTLKSVFYGLVLFDIVYFGLIYILWIHLRKVKIISINKKYKNRGNGISIILIYRDHSLTKVNLSQSNQSIESKTESNF